MLAGKALKARVRPLRQPAVAYFRSRAGLAQLVEHLICNHGVTGSSPVAGTMFSGV